MEPYGNQQGVGMLAGETPYQQSPLGNSVNTKNPDTMANRLEQITSALHEAEVQLSSVLGKIHGPGPEREKAPEKPNGISALTMDINARAQRLRVGLGELSSFLG